METVVVRTVHTMGSVVRAARVEVGMTQVELARRAGVGRTWLSQFEDGQKTSAPMDMVFRLLAVLGLPVDIRAVDVR
ncbi:MAG: helix-turn-helix domain-containing protein [Micrococcales bacterium]|nr:helix-turn-helix domain-containing protein [Micrococcales bacterium]